jgi:hypothetical protein
LVSLPPANGLGLFVTLRRRERIADCAELILAPETLLVKVGKIAAGKICHVVKPLGNLTTLADVTDVPRPEKRTNFAYPFWRPSKRTNVEHRPIEQVTKPKRQCLVCYNG